MESAKRRAGVLVGHIATGAEMAPLESQGVAAGELVLTQVQNGVALLTLNSPPVNALSPQLLNALGKAYQGEFYTW